MVVKLDTIDKVKEFVQITSNIYGNVSVQSGIYVVDGKSILGIFSLDLSTPVEVATENDMGDGVWNQLLKFKSDE